MLSREKPALHMIHDFYGVIAVNLLNGLADAAVHPVL